MSRAIMRGPIYELEGVRVEALRIQRRPDLSGHDDFSDLVDYWESARGIRDVPLRSDIDPIDLKLHLGSLFIAEHVPERCDFKFRLIGTLLTERYGVELTGLTMRQSFYDVDQKFCAAAIASMTRTLEEGIVFRGRGAIASARGYPINFEVLQLPLSSDGHRTDMVLGKWVYAGQR